MWVSPAMQYLPMCLALCVYVCGSMGLRAWHYALVRVPVCASQYVPVCVAVWLGVPFMCPFVWQYVPFCVSVCPCVCGCMCMAVCACMCGCVIDSMCQAVCAFVCGSMCLCSRFFEWWSDCFEWCLRQRQSVSVMTYLPWSQLPRTSWALPFVLVSFKCYFKQW